jgi:hypothetical protein
MSPARAPPPATRALDAVRQFYAEHGRLPQRREWEYAIRDRPCARTIDRRWGWRNLLAEAIGVEPDGLDLWVTARSGYPLALEVVLGNEVVVEVESHPLRYPPCRRHLRAHLSAPGEHASRLNGSARVVRRGERGPPLRTIP